MKDGDSSSCGANIMASVHNNNSNTVNTKILVVSHPRFWFPSYKKWGRASGTLLNCSSQSVSHCFLQLSWSLSSTSKHFLLFVQNLLQPCYLDGLLTDFHLLILPIGVV
mmetsp:Transcript_46201/g.112883  ORF Transcript_46201/g.112883 Transcript_46201/m.112883 type:complete len:109 (-) Transcript_46201:495-821(-)